MSDSGEHGPGETFAVPVVAWARLGRRRIVRGQDVVVTWAATGARSLRIVCGSGYRVDVPDPQRHPHGLAITPPAAGDVFVEAANGNGRTVAHAGFLEVYTLPALTLPAPPRLPRVPRVPAPRVAAPSVAALVGAPFAELATLLATVRRRVHQEGPA